MIAEARRRPPRAPRPDGDAGPLRKTILKVVARHADAATWDALRRAAAREKTPLDEGGALLPARGREDEALARRALDLALTAEPGATTGAGMLAAPPKRHAELVFDFALAHGGQWTRGWTRRRGAATTRRLAARSADPAMAGKIAATPARPASQRAAPRDGDRAGSPSRRGGPRAPARDRFLAAGPRALTDRRARRGAR